MSRTVFEPPASAEGVAGLGRSMEDAAALDTLRWAAERYGSRLTFATGLGAEGCVLVDLIGRHQLPIDIFTLDTGLLFPETYDLWTRLETRYGVTIRRVTPTLTVEAQAAEYGGRLWERMPDRCCAMRKVVPLRTELARVDAWITAIRREQTPERANAGVVEWDPKFAIVKVNPLARWTKRDIRAHLLEHRVPYNPLHDQGYPSLGCMPCTSAVGAGEDDRAGRWRGVARTECGLHGPAIPAASGAADASVFPAFLKLQGRPVVVIGAGPVAASKLSALRASGARITVVAPEMTPEVETSGAQLEHRPFRPADLDGAWLVVAAATPEVNRQVAMAAEARQLFVNAVDDPSNASLYLGGVVRRAGITVAISTDGRAPALAGLLREGLETLLPEAELQRWMNEAEKLRHTWRSENVPMDSRRPQLLEALIRLYDRGTENPDRGTRKA